MKRKFKFQTFGPLHFCQKAKIPVQLFFTYVKKPEVFEPCTTAGSYEKKYPTVFFQRVFFLIETGHFNFRPYEKNLLMQ